MERSCIVSPRPGRPRSEEAHRAILDATIALLREVGYDALYLGPVTTEQYAQQNCAVVRSYVSAIRDAIAYIEKTPAVWKTYAEALGHPEAALASQKLDSGSFVTEWTQKQIDEMTRRRA